MKITRKLIVIVVALLLVSPWFAMLHGVATTDIVESTSEPTSTVVHTTTAPTTEKVTTTKATTTTVESTEAKSTTTFRVSAYCACTHCTDGDGITASGTKATQGRTIAVDPRYYPYGTKIILNGETYIAEDCGGAIKGNRIDMYFDSHKEALEWGVRYLEGVVVWV